MGKTDRQSDQGWVEEIREENRRRAARADLQAADRRNQEPLPVVEKWRRPLVIFVLLCGVVALTTIAAALYAGALR